MFRKDYLVKQFEEFGKVMAVILKLRKEKDWEKLRMEISEATLKFTSVELDEAELLSAEDFGKKIINSLSLLPEQKKMLADLMFEKMWYYKELGSEDKFSDLRSKCLLLYGYYQNNLTTNEFNLEVHYRLNLLKSL